jgi:predicted ATP-grasp superfamily ATP-dependent carboligase
MFESKLSPTITTDEHSYFFTMLADRFNPLNIRWQKALEKRFNKPFRPIYILPFRHNKYFEEENYIVLNDHLASLQKELERSDIIFLIYPEDLNRQFCESTQIRRIVEQLIAKQGQVFVLSFTSVWLEFNNPKVVVLGPNGKVAAKYDAKSEHAKTFEKLGLPTIKTKVYRDFQELRTLQVEYPYFLSAMFTSGGIESRSIYTPEDLEAYYEGLRPANKVRPFIAAKLMTDMVAAPNSSALVSGEDQTTVVCISDQVLRDNHYMGNLYPSQVSAAHQKVIHEATIKVGNYLSREGFRGLFGLDFLISESGDCFPIDLNPRRQGGYYCQVMSSPTDLIDLEMRVIFNDPLPKFKYEDFQANYSWGHSKLTPYSPDVKILEEIVEGDPLEPFVNAGATHRAIYYPKDYTLIIGNPGFYLTSGSSYEDVKRRLTEETDKTISESYRIEEALVGLRKP